MTVTDQQDQLEREKAEQIVADAPKFEGVEGIRVEYDTDQTGDPAMWLVFRLSRDLLVDRAWVSKFNDYADELQDQITRRAFVRFPYIRIERAA